MSEDAAKPKPTFSWWRLLRWLLALPILLFIVPISVTEFSWFFESLYLLGVGWFRFLQRNLEALRFDPERVLTSLIVLGLAVTGLHLLARAWRRHVRPQAPVWRLRWSLGITGLALLFACAAMAVAGLAHQIAWMSGNPILRWGHHGQLRAASTARQLAMVINSYAHEHDDFYPPNLEALTRWSHQEEVARLEKLLFYQIDASHTPEPWLYFGADRLIYDRADALLLAAPRPVKGKRLIVTLDCMTSFEPESHFQKQLAAWNASRSKSGNLSDE